MPDENCSSCKWWQDYSDRVYAVIPSVRTNVARDRVELRRCRYVPPPSIVSIWDIYTEGSYVCGSYSHIRKEEQYAKNVD
jgi:hypothetical protein